MSKNCMSCKYLVVPEGEEPCLSCKESIEKDYPNYELREENDPVFHPNHYQSKSGLEVIDVIKAFTEDCEGVEAYYAGNVIEYVCRWKKKNGLEDLKKARQYLDWLIATEDPNTPEEEKNMMSKFNDIRDSLPEEKKEPPKNGRYSMSDDDCFVPWEIRPHMTPVYPIPGPCCCGDKEWNKPKDIYDIIWTEFWRVFYESLNEANEEKEKENKKDEK